MQLGCICTVNTLTPAIKLVLSNSHIVPPSSVCDIKMTKTLLDFPGAPSRTPKVGLVPSCNCECEWGKKNQNKSQPSSYLHPSPQQNSCFHAHCTLTADRSTAGAAGAGAGSGAGAGAGAGSAFLAGALGSFLGAISADSRATLSLKHKQIPMRVTTQGV